MNKLLLNNEKIIVIGDVHGKTNEYQEIINKESNSFTIQVGDFGFKDQHEWFLKNIDTDKNKISFGNHDHTGYLDFSHSLGNYTYIESHSIFTVRGAESIDRFSRTEGVSWFRDEQLTYAQSMEVLDSYLQVLPRIVITHDCPNIIRDEVFNISNTTITSNLLQTMYEMHQPEIWIFGHHHKSISLVYENTKFICLNELETFVI